MTIIEFEYLRAHIEQLKKAVIDDGVDLMGYTPWGLYRLRIIYNRGNEKKDMASSMLTRTMRAKEPSSEAKRSHSIGIRRLLKAKGSNWIS